MGIEVAWDHAQTFISATFSGAERHRRRLSKLAQLEGLAASS
jgi:ribose 5-phosphate isomerase RpiB